MRLLSTALLLSVSVLAADKDDKDVALRVDKAATVFSEIMAAPDKGIPRDLLEKAHCIVVVPDLKKGAFIVGAKYGKGVLSCRTSAGGWSAPGAVRVEGGSVGLQIGGSVTDVVLLVMNERGANKLLSDQFTLGGEGEVAAGPVGRTAAAGTDAKMSAEILSWSRTHGIFAGLSLQGATLRQDTKDNELMYGKALTNQEIVKGGTKPPASADKLLAALNRYPMHEKP
jgi:lipid-binding SYLF domain-containing protein